MTHWKPQKPTPSKLGDHDVPFLGDHLKDKKIALLVTGGIAAMKAPLIARELRRYQGQVVAYMSEEAKKYVTKDALEWSTDRAVVDQLSPRAEHLSENQPIDIYLLAPATYNSINKTRHGIADNLVTTTLATALGRMEKGEAEVLLCPTMHGNMHNSILQESLEHLISLGVKVLPPRDAYGKHNIPDTEDLVAQVIALTSKSNLKDKTIMVTGGPTPTKIDNVRRLTNKFTGTLGMNIARELYLQGAQVKFVLGESGISVPSCIPTLRVPDYETYRDQVLNELSKSDYEVGIFSAAVADYQPKTTAPGKIPSGGELRQIDLVPTEKVIDLVQEKFPSLKMISFKYEENTSHEDLMKIAHTRLDRGHLAVLANRGEEFEQHQDQVSYLVQRNQSEKQIIGKVPIAREICKFLEGHFQC